MQIPAVNYFQSMFFYLLVRHDGDFFLLSDLSSIDVGGERLCTNYRYGRATGSDSRPTAANYVLAPTVLKYIRTVVKLRPQFLEKQKLYKHIKLK